MPTETTNWYQLDTDTAAERLGSSAKGLPEAEAARRLAADGPNELEDRGGRTSLQIFLAQFRDLFTLILVVAAVISAALGDLLETIVILAIIVLNSVMGYVQERKAEQAMAALKRLAVPTVHVLRDGEPVERSARDLVAGDVLILDTGSAVPADGRLIEAVNLEVEEAALTGESEPVAKEVSAGYETERAIADRRNVLYMGTTVSRGRARLLITATGMGTELGKIADLIQSVEDEQTPLQRRLDHLAKVLAIAAGLIVIVIFGLGLARGESVETMLLTSVSLAVAAIPEAMPAVVTIALSLGAQRMLKRRALIRRLPAVETLGSVSVICSDKTGTLTQNRMTVTVLDVANRRIDLSGTGPGDLRSDSTIAVGVAPTLQLALTTGALCNDATLTTETDEGRRAVGDPTEAALVVSAAEFGLDKGTLEASLPRVAEVPFDSARKRMTTIHRTPRTAEAVPAGLADLWHITQTEDVPEFVGLTKGSVEGLVGLSGQVWVEGSVEPLDDGWAQRILEAAGRLADRGMRVLAVAVRGWDAVPDTHDPGVAERDLVLVGLFGMMDPPRPEVAAAVAECRSAGIRPVMITGDHPLTARHVAQQVGISDGDTVLIGNDIDRLDDEALERAAAEVSVFARVAPEHKLRLIAAFQRQDKPSAMTGDGVNDAPALKKADIGVAMGITGTDVAKQASDMVLLDDNFATIVAAVEEGRVIYDNIRKFIKYLLTCNASEIAVMVVGPLLGMPLPLLPLQILWMNLVTDGLPALALGVEPPEDDVMRRPPRAATETIFGGGVVPFIIGFGALMALISLGTGWTMWQADAEHWRTVLFTTLIFSQLALALEVRAERRSLVTMGLLSNKPMLAAVAIGLVSQLVLIYVPVFQRIFDTAALSAAELGLAFGASLIIIVGVEVQKWWSRRSTLQRSTQTTPS